MRSILEQIPKAQGSSFRILANPRLSEFYFWHFHPEVELVYINARAGIRHVGNHKSKYQNGDLALIGPYIPHLNFDYGVKEDYYKIVLQMDIDFLGRKQDLPEELNMISQLLRRSYKGLIFGENIKHTIGKKMKQLEQGSSFQRFQQVIEILNVLAYTRDFTYLHEEDYQGQFYQKQEEKIRKVLRYIESNFDQRISIAEVASLSNYSEAAFCRYFKKMTKLTFTAFLNNYRVDMAKRMLIEGKTISESAFTCGFESLSYFNRVFQKNTGDSPRSWLGKLKMANP